MSPCCCYFISNIKILIYVHIFLFFFFCSSSCRISLSMLLAYKCWNGVCDRKQRQIVFHNQNPKMIYTWNGWSSSWKHWNHSINEVKLKLKKKNKIEWNSKKESKKAKAIKKNNEIFHGMSIRTCQHQRYPLHH